MNTEFEAKAVKINKEKIRRKLKKMGAKLVFKEKKYTRVTYKLPVKLEGGWGRLRTDGDKTTLAIKQVLEKSVTGTKEIEIEVNDFEKTRELLKMAGWKEQNYQENLRERWIFDDVEFDIDTWPVIDPYIEIEAKNEEKVKEWFEKLDLDFNKAYFGSSDIVYKEVYNIDIISMPVLIFNDKNKCLKK
jgi:adenylate cyclase class 2